MKSNLNLIGQKFQKLLVTEKIEAKNNRSKPRWRCLCCCGNYVEKTEYDLIKKKVKSCGCMKYPTKNIPTIDMAGQKFGKLLAIKVSDRKNTKIIFYECLCDCGNVKDIRGSSLREGFTKSCGCLLKPNLVGQKFNRLLVIKEHNKKKLRSGGYKYYWECLCDCGKTVISCTEALRYEKRKSCGCLTAENNKNKRTPVHVLGARNVYRTYKLMASKRNIKFDITLEQAILIFDKDCIYCKKAPSNTFQRKNIKDTFSYSGIDRVDPNKGYSMDNTVPCCRQCNMAKSDNMIQEFVAWIERVAKHKGL